MKIRNQVTAKPTPQSFFVVSMSWQGGEDKRKITLENWYDSEKESLAEKERLEKNEHGYVIIDKPSITLYRAIQEF